MLCQLSYRGSGARIVATVPARVRAQRSVTRHVDLVLGVRRSRPTGRTRRPSPRPATACSVVVERPAGGRALPTRSPSASRAPCRRAPARPRASPRRRSRCPTRGTSPAPSRPPPGDSTRIGGRYAAKSSRVKPGAARDVDALHRRELRQRVDDLGDLRPGRVGESTVAVPAAIVTGASSAERCERGGSPPPRVRHAGRPTRSSPPRDAEDGQAHRRHGGVSLIVVGRHGRGRAPSRSSRSLPQHGQSAHSRRQRENHQRQSSSPAIDRGAPILWV